MRRWVRRARLAILVVPIVLGVRCGGGSDGPVPAASTSVSGRILGPDGAPAAGVSVTAWLVPPAGYAGCGGTPPATPEPVGQTTQTGPDGRYAFVTDASGAAVASVSIVPSQASPSGEYRFLPSNRSATVSYGQETGGLDFTAYPLAATLAGTVTGRSGEPLPGIAVNALHVSASVPFDFSATTAPDGSYSLRVAAGDYRVLAVAPANRFFAPPQRTVAVAGGGATDGLDFAEVPPGTITVTAASPSGPLAGFRATATSSDNVAFRADAGAGGTAVLPVPPGTYTVVPEKTCCTFQPSASTATIGAWGEDAPLSFGVTLPDRTTPYRVSGTVTDAIFGMPIAGRTVRMTGEGLDLSTVSDPSGQFSFSVPNGDYTLAVEGGATAVPVAVCRQDVSGIRLSF